MSITFADVVHQTISFSREVPSQQLVLRLIDTPWMQRLRDISQTGNCRLLYMFSEHSRFGHSVGVAYLADMLLEKLSAHFPRDVAQYRDAVTAAALLHDIGHLAPGSHTAFRTWYPDQPDTHEELSVRVLREDADIHGILAARSAELPSLVAAILSESRDLPPWTWEIISGGGWNVDRGNWSIVDSTLAGVSYGKYNIPALLESMTISDDRHLVLRENRLDAMMHFMVSRHAMYKQIYLHRVLLAVDTLNKAIVMRARELGDKVDFADEPMRAMLASKNASDLTLPSMFAVRDPWWRYHVVRWSESKDAILRDLSDRLLNRRLLKTVRLRDTDTKGTLWAAAEGAVRAAGFEPRFYLHEVSTIDMHAGDFQHSMPVLMDDGRLRNLADAEPLFQAMVRDAKVPRSWIVLPEEAKTKLGRDR